MCGIAGYGGGVQTKVDTEKGIDVALIGDVTDGDFDPLGTQHIFANISNEWII